MHRTARMVFHLPAHASTLEIPLLVARVELDWILLAELVVPAVLIRSRLVFLYLLNLFFFLYVNRKCKKITFLSQ